MPNDTFFLICEVSVQFSEAPTPKSNVGMLPNHCMNKNHRCIGGAEGEVKTMFIFTKNVKCANIFV